MGAAPDVGTAGANFLHEAWATLVEALVLRAWYGADAERSFWERQHDSYMVGADRAGHGLRRHHGVAPQETHDLQLAGGQGVWR